MLSTGTYVINASRTTTSYQKHSVATRFPHIDIISAMVIVWRVRGNIIRYVLCNIVCNNIVYSATHTHMSRPNSSLDWVLSHGAHFTVLRFIFVCIMCRPIIVYCVHV